MDYFNFKNISIKGLRVYLVAIFLLFSFYTYSQAIGWRWWFATETTPPAGEKQGHRYFFHK
jgi:hypothetical protein